MATPSALFLLMYSCTLQWCTCVGMCGSLTLPIPLLPSLLFSSLLPDVCTALALLVLRRLPSLPSLFPPLSAAF